MATITLSLDVKKLRLAEFLRLVPEIGATEAYKRTKVPTTALKVLQGQKVVTMGKNKKVTSVAEISDEDLGAAAELVWEALRMGAKQHKPEDVIKPNENILGTEVKLEIPAIVNMEVLKRVPKAAVDPFLAAVTQMMESLNMAIDKNHILWPYKMVTILQHQIELLKEEHSQFVAEANTTIEEIRNGVTEQAKILATQQTEGLRKQLAELREENAKLRADAKQLERLKRMLGEH